LNFPYGLCETNNERFNILSYGDGDAYCKFLVVDKTKLKFNNQLKKPEDWSLLLIDAKNDNNYNTFRKDFQCTNED
jgi:hypothetical protein